jgi:hypothetical protein
MNSSRDAARKNKTNPLFILRHSLFFGFSAAEKSCSRNALPVFEKKRRVFPFSRSITCGILLRKVR